MTPRDIADALTGEQARDVAFAFLTAAQMADNGMSPTACVRALQHACSMAERMATEVPSRIAQLPLHRQKAERTKLRGIVAKGGPLAKRAERQLAMLNGADHEHSTRTQA